MKSPVLGVLALLSAMAALAQTESARISGRVTDLSGAVIVGAECKITNIETDVSTSTMTNEDGIYVLPDLHPATYRLTIQREGSRTVIRPNLQLYVQDAVNENFTLALGPASETVTVLGNSFGLQTDSAAVSTVVDFPRNGLRSPYSINQTDLAVRRQFGLTERVKLDVRVEYFNVFNHPMFGIAGSQCNPQSNWSTRFGESSTFGQICPGSTTNVDAGEALPSRQNALYAVGGPRSAQFTLKVHF